jgi:signal transduction histidine kinase
VQEGLTNARKHAPGRAVAIRLHGRPGAELEIDICNALTGLALPDRGGLRTPGTGTGLVGLAERAELAGGRLAHQVTPAGEFCLHAALPWPE